jgi:hypothetical protein
MAIGFAQRTHLLELVNSLDDKWLMTFQLLYLFLVAFIYFRDVQCDVECRADRSDKFRHV